MNKLLPTTSIYLLATAALTYGQFVVVDDFQDGDISDWNTTTNFEGPEITAAISVVADPADANNNVLSVFPGTPQISNLNLRAWRSIPALPVDGSLATVFVRFNLPSVALSGGGTAKAIADSVWGTTSIDAPSSYGDYSTINRIEPNQSFDLFDGATGVGYRDLRDSTQQLTAGEWYNLWWVIDSFNTTTLFYIQGGPEYPTQTLLYSIDENNPVLWRNKTFDAIDQFLITTSAGNLTEGAKGIDAMFFDDLYVDLNGANLTNPAVASTPKGPGIFADLDMDENGWVNAPWMGFVNTDFYPWCYSFQFDTFFFVTGNDTTSPIWIYIQR